MEGRRTDKRERKAGKGGKGACGLGDRRTSKESAGTPPLDSWPELVLKEKEKNKVK